MKEQQNNVKPKYSAHLNVSVIVAASMIVLAGCILPLPRHRAPAPFYRPPVYTPVYQKPVTPVIKVPRINVRPVVPPPVIRPVRPAPVVLPVPPVPKPVH